MANQPNNQYRIQPGNLLPSQIVSGWNVVDCVATSPIETVSTDQPLVGFRAWRVQKVDEKHYLQSTYKDTTWPHRARMERGGITQNVFEGTVEPRITDYDLSKGIHAIKEKHKLGELCVDYRDTRVCGELNMWGEVTETRDGWLAQYAYPKNLWVMSDMDPVIIMELEDNYGVPVIVNEAVEMVYKSSVSYDSKLRDLERYAQVLCRQGDSGYIKNLELRLAEARNHIEELRHRMEYERMQMYSYSSVYPLIKKDK